MKLAIKGHSTRGKEVIELLEMMGGKDTEICSNPSKNGCNINMYYFINSFGEIIWDNTLITDEAYFLTLEEFLEKFPFKVGDKVYIYVQNDDTDGRYDIEVAEISSMRWNSARCKIAYKMKDINRDFYKEEIKCKVDDNHTNPSKMKKVLEELLDHIKNTSKEALEKEFNELEEWSHVGPTVEEFMDFCNKVYKKPEYPKTYKECCGVLGMTYDYPDIKMVSID